MVTECPIIFLRMGSELSTKMTGVWLQKYGYTPSLAAPAKAWLARSQNPERVWPVGWRAGRWCACSGCPAPTWPPPPSKRCSRERAVVGHAPRVPRTDMAVVFAGVTLILGFRL